MATTKNITTITTTEVREAWDKVQAGKFPLTHKQSEGLGHLVQGWRGDRYDDWNGCSGKQMQTWLHEGYWPEGEDMPNLSGSDVEVSMPFIGFDEDEGDLSIEMALNGEDMYRLHWDAMDSPKGMKIRACFDFNAGVNATIMRDYFAWVLNVIERAEGLGIAPDVELFIETQGSFQGHDSRHDMIAIPVVKAGELVDTVAWRAYLTKGGFRTLGFLALGLAGDKLGLSLTGSLGRATGHKWDVTLDEDDVLTLHAPGNASSFDKTAMNKALEKAWDKL